jgi:micrococcal nuclease
MHSLLLYISLFLLTSCQPVTPKVGETLEGKVVRIIDGDTFELLVNQQPYRIRMHAIDCPERGQDFYSRCREALSDHLFQQTVRVKIVDRERNNGRYIGDVYTKYGEYINGSMIRDGYAWHFKRYSKDASLAKLEDAARAAKVGLWSQGNPIPPWEYRQQKRTKPKSLS